MTQPAPAPAFAPNCAETVDSPLYREMVRQRDEALAEVTEMRAALRRVGIGTSDECGDKDDMVEWFATTENGEEGCGTLDAALEILIQCAANDAVRARDNNAEGRAMGGGA